MDSCFHILYRLLTRALYTNLYTRERARYTYVPLTSTSAPYTQRSRGNIMLWQCFGGCVHQCIRIYIYIYCGHIFLGVACMDFYSELQYWDRYSSRTMNIDNVLLTVIVFFWTTLVCDFDVGIYRRVIQETDSARCGSIVLLFACWPFAVIIINIYYNIVINSWSSSSSSKSSVSPLCFCVCMSTIHLG